LERAAAGAKAAAADLERRVGPELVAVNLMLAGDCLVEIMGGKAGSDVLDAIFNRFCIGK
jgi:tRNA U34 5-carboxymethylaminomethyl modifying GTPase MnmE/TrmE